MPRTWEPIWLREPEPPPYKITVYAFWCNNRTADLALQCSCGQELTYEDDQPAVPLGELNEAAAGHLRSHGSPRPATVSG